MPIYYNHNIRQLFAQVDNENANVCIGPKITSPSVFMMLIFFICIFNEIRSVRSNKKNSFKFHMVRQVIPNF